VVLQELAVEVPHRKRYAVRDQQHIGIGKARRPRRKKL
jgi:hypothetical protein